MAVWANIFLVKCHIAEFTPNIKTLITKPPTKFRFFVFCFSPTMNRQKDEEVLNLFEIYLHNVSNLSKPFDAQCY
jgi:hypothetical protein